MPNPSATDLLSSLENDLRALVLKYKPVMSGAFVGAAVCLVDYNEGALSLSARDEFFGLDANLAMALSLLATALQQESNPQVQALVKRAERALTVATTLKTGDLLTTVSLH